MTWSTKDSQVIYDELRAVSADILKAIGCPAEPHEVNGKGKTRTCQFKPINGQKRYRGVLYHYTAGVAEVGTLQWGNHPGWGNKECSWHVTIMDRISDTVIGEKWANIDKQLRLLFPVPTIIMADWKWGTWHGNWTCDATLGVENRNSGYSYEAKGGKAKLGKDPIVLFGKRWEPYTREQIVANVNLGRLANGWIDGQLDPDWVLSHQCVWATKADTGPAYPIHYIRQAIFTEDDLATLDWIKFFSMAPDTNIDVDEVFEPLDEVHIESATDYVKWAKPTPGVKPAEPNWTAAVLYGIGFNTGPELPTAKDVEKNVKWFQRSTGAYKNSGHPEWVLTPDGVAGPKTIEGIRRRCKQLGMKL